MAFQRTPTSDTMIQNNDSFHTVIEIDVLLENLHEGSWAIFDCRYEITDPEHGERVYLEGHIPGAQYINLEHDLSAPPNGRNGRHPLPSANNLAMLFSSWGIDRGTQVVAYDARGGGFAARLWWLLRFLGHFDVAILNGGYPEWIRKGCPVNKGRETRSAARFIPQVQMEMLVDYNDVERLNSPPKLLGAAIEDNEKAVCLIDSRAPGRYAGLEEPYDPVAGHIPGAINRDWTLNLDREGKFISKTSIRSAFNSILVESRPSDAIVYCGSGITACLNILAMEYAGLEGARLYDGSWSEWCSDPDRPVAPSSGN